VCYKGNAVSYAIAKRLIKIKYISLVNLIMDKPVIKELIQDELNVENIVTELKKIIEDNDVITQITDDYDQLRKLLAQGGNASEKAAKSIASFLRAKNAEKQTISKAV
jgi:lipid-A-disaccharide synthase